MSEKNTAIRAFIVLGSILIFLGLTFLYTGYAGPIKGLGITFGVERPYAEGGWIFIAGGFVLLFLGMLLTTAKVDSVR